MKQTLRSLVGGVILLGMTLAAEAAAASTAAGESGRSVRNSASAAPVVGEAVTVFTEGEAGYAGFRIPVVIRTDDGALIAFAEARRHDKRDSGDIDLVMRRSEDDGRTWGPITTVWDDGDNTCGNPAPAVLGGGRIVMLATWNRGCDRERQIEQRTSVDTRRIFVLRSEDHGRTWSRPEEITSGVKDPEWTWYATGPCHAIVKRRAPHKGRIVVPANHKRLENGGRVGIQFATALLRRRGPHVAVGSHFAARRERKHGRRTRGRLAAAEHAALRTRRQPPSVRREPRRRDKLGRPGRTSRIGRTPLSGKPAEPHARRPSHPAAALLQPPRPAPASQPLAVREPRQQPDMAPSGDRLPRPSAYSDLVRLDRNRVGVLYENGDADDLYRRISFTVITLRP